jgi:chemotaxis protein histidine kinase CheA
VGKFNDFARSTTEFITANRRLIQDTADRDLEVIAALFRNMHTIKGNARTFEFKQITDVAHVAEQTYDTLRKSDTSKFDQATLSAELDAVEAAVTHYVRVNDDTLGRKGRASDLMTTRGSFVAREKLAQLRAMAAVLAAAHADAAEMQREVDQLGLVPFDRLVSGALDSISSLATELNKPSPELALDATGKQLWLNPQFAEAFKSCLMHIMRNALDHGIEVPHERQRANKPPQGVMTIECSRQSEGLELRISDDGKGLALHRLYEQGVANGIFGHAEKPTPEAIAETIFQSGVSTATQVTQVSGRGVGMDAVRTFLKEHGATIRVALREAGVALGFTPFNFIIKLPPTAESY